MKIFTQFTVFLTTYAKVLFCYKILIFKKILSKYFSKTIKDYFENIDSLNFNIEQNWLLNGLIGSK